MFHLIFGIGRDQGLFKKLIGISSVTFNAQSEQLSLTRQIPHSPNPLLLTYKQQLSVLLLHSDSVFF